MDWLEETSAGKRTSFSIQLVLGCIDLQSWLASPVPHEIFWMGFVNYLKTTSQTMKSKNAHECTPNSEDELKDPSGPIARSKG
jgi:hypothetical protein